MISIRIFNVWFGFFKCYWKIFEVLKDPINRFVFLSEMINTDSYSLFVFTTQRRFSSSLTPIYFGGLALVSWPEGGELLTCRICRLLRRRKASDTLQQKLIRRSNCVWMPPAPFRRQSPPPEMWNVAVSELMGGSLADGTSTQVVTGEWRVMFRSCLNCDLNYTRDVCQFKRSEVCRKTKK